MGKRVTIVMNVEIDRKLRLLQTKLILKRNKSVSYSSVVNELLGKVL